MPIIAKSPFMQKLAFDLGKIAKGSANIFVSGESGTGKDFISREIHALSPRSNAPFVKIHPSLISEIEQKEKSTLLLDEISEIPIAVQFKLLHFIQDGVDVRFISTSSCNMKEVIGQKRFREDLYYRLNVIPIHLPPLRKRVEDILPLAHHFLQQHGEGFILSKEAERKLLEYHWPGNVRELSNVIESAAILTINKIICKDDLILDISPNASEKLEGKTLHEVEKLHILRTLSAHKNNRTKAAKALGISVRTIRNKLNMYSSSL